MNNSVSQFEGDRPKKRSEGFQAWFEKPSRVQPNRSHDVSTPCYELETDASDMLDMFELCVSPSGTESIAAQAVGLSNQQDDMEWRMAL